METPNTELLRGRVEIFILKALSESAGYGYDIINYIKNKTEGHYKIKQSTVYNILKRLEINGLITSYTDDETNGAKRCYYALTEEGKKKLKAQEEEWAYTRTLIDNLVSDKSFDLKNDTPPFQPSDLRPLTKRAPRNSHENVADNVSREVSATVNDTYDDDLPPEPLYSPVNPSDSATPEHENTELIPEVAEQPVEEKPTEIIPEETHEATEKPVVVPEHTETPKKTFGDAPAIDLSEFYRELYKDKAQPVESAEKPAPSPVQKPSQIIDYMDFYRKLYEEKQPTRQNPEPVYNNPPINENPVAPEVNEEPVIQPVIEQVQETNPEIQPEIVPEIKVNKEPKTPEFTENTDIIYDIDCSQINALKNRLETEGITLKTYERNSSKGLLKYVLVNKLFRDSVALSYLFLVITLLVIYFCKPFEATLNAVLIVGGVALILPIAALIISLNNPGKRKKDNVNIKILLTVCMIVYVAFFVVNLIISLIIPNGHSLNSVATYAPCIVFLTIPAFGCFYSILYKTKNYHLKTI